MIVDKQTPETIPAMEVGDRIRFVPQSNRLWWTVRARDERWIIATCPTPFQPKGDLWYCVVDLYRPFRHNGVGPGMVRSSLNAMGGGWPWDAYDQAAFDEAMADLNHELGWELSNRRLLGIDRFEVAA